MALFRLLPALVLTLAPAIAMAKGKSVTGTPVLSSDGLFEFYSTPEGVQNDIDGKPFDFGEKLHIRRHGQESPSPILLENDRWMHVEWAPQSHLLGLEDHWDGHASIVYVYEISTEVKSGHIQYKLVFQSPRNDYDRQWFIEGWDVAHRKIQLRLEQRGGDGILGHENWPDSLIKHETFLIGTRALSEKE